MNDIDAYRGLEDVLSTINSKLVKYQDDDRLSAYIKEILYGKIFDIHGRKELIGGTLALIEEVKEVREFMQTEEDIKSLPIKEVHDEMGDNCSHQTD